MMQSIVKLPSLCCITVAAVAIFASDKKGRFPSVFSFRPPIYFSSPSISAMSSINRIDSRLFAKPKNKKGKTKNIANNNRNFETSEGTPLAANLKRKVQAKRDPLGHVVPEATRTKGCELLFFVLGQLFLEYSFCCLARI